MAYIKWDSTGPFISQIQESGQASTEFKLNFAENMLKKCQVFFVLEVSQNSLKFFWDLVHIKPLEARYARSDSNPRPPVVVKP